MPRGLLKFVVLTIAIAFLLWGWASLYYTFLGISVAEARPWTMPIVFMAYHSEKYFMMRALWSGLVILAIAMIFVLVWLRDRMGVDLGKAKFAGESEIRKAGLRSKAGLVLGKYGSEYLVDDGQTHVLVAAPTGSGKGVGVVIPNLLNWNGSAVVLDIKGENFTLTSGFREQHGQRIVRFSPFMDKSHRFNPFDVINQDPRQRYNDINNIANVLLPDNEKDPTWSQQGRALFSAFASYLLDKPGEVCTIGNILRHLQTADDTRDVAKAIIASEGDRLDPAAQRTFANFSQQEKRMSESVKVGLVGALSLWNSSSIDAATSATDFDPYELRSKRTTIYVVISLADLDSIRPLLTLFFELLFASQLRKEPGPEDKHKVLFLMDEFESLGTMNGVVDKLPFVRSYGIRVLAIIQGLSQLDQRYGTAGRDKVLQGSRHQIYFASNDGQTTEYVSSTLGMKTITTKSRSKSQGGRSTSRQAQTRALMLPQEVRELPPTDMVLITEGAPPIRAKKIRYFKDKVLAKRAGQTAPEIPALDLDPKRSPTLEQIAGEDIAQTIRSSKQGGGGGRDSAPKPSKPSARTGKPKGAFSDLLKAIDKDSENQSLDNEDAD